MATQEELDQLRKASKESSSKARELLDSEVKSVMDMITRISEPKPRTTDEETCAKAKSVMDLITRISELKPRTTDKETYKNLIHVVSDASANNESIATVKKNVKKLGSTAVSLFKEMAVAAKSLT